jgi:hypothetical protein
MARALTFVLALQLAVVACGGDDDGDLGFDPDTTYDQATVEEAMAFCEHIQASVDRAAEQKIDCYVEGIVAQDQEGADCQAVADACLEEPVDDDPADCGDITQEEIDDAPDCADQVTFGEVLDCFDALGDQNASVAGEISCDSDLEEILDTPQPEACTRVISQCPELFEN